MQGKRHTKVAVSSCPAPLEKQRRTLSDCEARRHLATDPSEAVMQTSKQSDTGTPCVARRARHEEQRGGTVFHEGKPWCTMRYPCHGMRRARVPAKPCLRATCV